MRSSTARVVLLLGAALGGCHSVGLPPELAPGPPVAGRLAMAPALATYEPSDSMRTLPRPAFGVGALAPRVVAILRARGADVAHAASGVPAAAFPVAFGDAALGAARDGRRRAGTELARVGNRRLVEIDAVDAKVDATDQPTPLFVLKALILVGALPFPDVPNWFIACDRYALTLKASVRLVEPASGLVIGEKQVEGRCEGAFGDLSRGFYYYSTLRVPNCLDEESWARITDALRPSAEEALARSCARAVEELAAER